MSLSGFWLRGVSCALNKIYLKRGKDNHRGQTSHLKCPRYNRSEVDLIELCTHVWRSSLSVSVFFFFSLREAEPTRFHFKTTRTHRGSNVSSPFSLTNEWATARSAVTGLMRPVFTPPRPESNTVKAAETHCLLILQLCEVFSKGSWIFPFHFFFFFFSLLLDLIHAHRNSCKVATDLFFFFSFLPFSATTHIQVSCMSMIAL